MVGPWHAGINAYVLLCQDAREVILDVDPRSIPPILEDVTNRMDLAAAIVVHRG